MSCHNSQVGERVNLSPLVQVAVYSCLLQTLYCALPPGLLLGFFFPVPPMFGNVSSTLLLSRRPIGDKTTLTKIVLSQLSKTLIFFIWLMRTEPSSCSCSNNSGFEMSQLVWQFQLTDIHEKCEDKECRRRLRTNRMSCLQTNTIKIRTRSKRERDSSKRKLANIYQP